MQLRRSCPPVSVISILSSSSDFWTYRLSLAFSLLYCSMYAMGNIQSDDCPNSHPDPLQAHSERPYASELSASSHKTEKSQLGVNFQPSDSSVICGRGKASYEHPGNCRLRMLASTFAADYAQAERKSAKSAIVANIVADIRQEGGSLFKNEKGEWFEIADYNARERVSALIRDNLQDDYKSSAKAKTARRRDQTTRSQTQSQTQIQGFGQQPVEGIRHSSEGTRHLNDSSIKSTDSLGFDDSLELDFFEIDDVF
jgi:hypothetical protein